MRHFTIQQEEPRARETRNLAVYREINWSSSHYLRILPVMVLFTTNLKVSMLHNKLCYFLRAFMFCAGAHFCDLCQTKHKTSFVVMSTWDDQELLWLPGASKHNRIWPATELHPLRSYTGLKAGLKSQNLMKLFGHICKCLRGKCCSVFVFKGAQHLSAFYSNL